MTGRQPLRPYQAEAIRAAREAYRAGKRAILLVAPTGAGKTRLGVEIAAGALAKGGSVLWLAHREELLTQARDRLLAEGLPRVGVIAAGEPVINAPVQVASIQTLAARAARGLPPGKVVVFDECVTPDTMIGDKRADEIHVGDAVPSWDGERVVWRRVSYVFRNVPSTLRTLRARGKWLCCTDAHPIWVLGRGYVEACEVREGDLCRLWCPDEALPEGMVCTHVQRGVPRGCAPAAASEMLDLRRADALGEGARLAEDVLAGVSCEACLARDDGDEQKTRGCTNAETQPDAMAYRSHQDGRDTTTDRASALDAWWQRERAVAAPGGAARASRRGMDCRASSGGYAEGTERASHVLHRSGARRYEDGDRDRRREPWHVHRKGEGCDPRGVPQFARVDRVEVHEPTSDGTFGGLCPEGVVFNFEVEGEHNFFANGFLTHNCHHYAASTWGEVAAAYKDSVRLGLTATPERGDGVGLGDLFDHVVPVSSVRELQELGVLVPCVTYAPSTPTKDLSQDPVAAYMARTPGERAFVFCVNVAHAEKLALAFMGQGIAAATIHADTPWLLRRARLEAFRRQDPQPLREAGTLEKAPLVLCNVYTLTEGVDVPEATCCVLARGCGHPGMLLQMVGRVLRAAPGKERAVLIDLRGVVHKLGLPEADREWSLEGKPIRLAAGEREEKLKTCPACSGVFAVWKADREGWRVCPLCRERIAPPEPPQVSPRELHAMGAAAPAVDREKHLAKLAKVAVSRGRKPGWIAFAFKERFGCFPPFGAAKRAYQDAGGEAA